MAAELIGAAGMNMATSIMNNLYATRRTIADRAANYKYNEMAADNADARTRALYEDIYSPQALLKNYKEAGLSPAIMYGGTPGQGGMVGAKGNGTSGLQTPFAPISMVEAAQAALMIAQTKKTQAETSNIEEDTQIKNIQKRLNQLDFQQYKTEWSITNSMWKDEQGNWTSAFEIAKKSNSYEQFLETLKKEAENNEQEDLIMQMAQEPGQKALRNIYISTERFEWNIATLSSDKVSANFQEQLIKALENTEFKQLNAKAACGWLKANIETAELTETQKEAWNNLISRLGEKGETMRDIIVVLGMILNNAASNWNMPQIHQHNQYNTKNTYEL